MNFLNWNDYLRTGISVVDEQHHGLIDLVNELAPLLVHAGEQPFADIAALQDRLAAYAEEHFRTEEGLMVRFGVDSRVFEPHQRSHAAFVAKIKALEEGMQRGLVATGDELLAFLAGWLIVHILGEDQTMARQILAIDAGLPPERAYREAGGYRTTPANEAVTAILIDLYRQMIRPSGTPVNGRAGD